MGLGNEILITSPFYTVCFSLELEFLEGERSLCRAPGHVSPGIISSALTFSPRSLTGFSKAKYLFSSESGRRSGRVKMPLHLEKLTSVFFESISKDYAAHFNGALGTYSVCL